MPQLLIEVSDSTLHHGLQRKAPLYGSYGIPELWVMDLTNQVLFVHHEPGANGYKTVEPMHIGQSVAPLFASDVSFSVDELFGA